MSKMSPEEEEAVQAEFAQLEREARGEVSLPAPRRLVPTVAYRSDDFADGRRCRAEAKDRTTAPGCTFYDSSGGYGRGVRGGPGQAESTARGGPDDHRHAELNGDRWGTTACFVVPTGNRVDVVHGIGSVSTLFDATPGYITRVVRPVSEIVSM